MNIKTSSYDSVVIYFAPIISEESLDKVQTSYQRLKELKGVIDLTPSYTSILLIYDIFLYDDQSIKEAIIKTCSIPSKLLFNNKKSNTHITIPTNYSNNLDLQRVATHNNLSMDEVIDLHTKTSYRVYAIGFMVGFAYLANLDQKIATPRLESPRNKVPKGAVAIADRQTAIYPQNSAGGWNIIGQTDFNDFTIFQVGDYVRFVSL
jgi:KipI family sensor histidine kinase inhibitor